MFQLLLFVRRFLSFERGPRDFSQIGEWTLTRSGSKSSKGRVSHLRDPKASPGLVPRGLVSDVDRISPSLLSIVYRFCFLVFAALRWFLANVADWMFVGWPTLLKEDSSERRELLVRRRAERLRKLMQRLGGTFVKVGQQLSIRSDILPPAYCQELASLLDDAEPFDSELVGEIIEKETGKTLGEIFEAFDEEPIGKASVACVYRARLHGGDRVAVKIRRPRIIHLFKADLAALDFLLSTAEFLTILRSGITRTLRDELRRLLLEELDLRTEARYQELFRRYIKGWKKLRITAPAIYPALCSEGIIVSELIEDALSAKKILEMLTRGNEEELALLDEMGISTKKIAKQLIRASHFQFYDCPFFHGDPHPANILVRPGNRLVMIDFGACGTFAEIQRHYLRRMHQFQAREDIGGMVRCVIHLMEPLPPMEMSGFRRDLESAWWQGFYGIQSRHAEWWERTSFRLWAALLRLVREYNIPLPLNVLRMIRATLLYDTVAARLYPRIDVFAEFRHYQRHAARRTENDFEDWVARQLVCGIDPMLFVRLKQVGDVADSLLFEAQRLLGTPSNAFTTIISKASSLTLIFLKWSISCILITTLAFGGLAFFQGKALMGHIRAELADEQNVAVEKVDYSALDFWVYSEALADVYEKHRELHGLQAAEIALLLGSSWFFLIGLITLKYLREAWFRLASEESFL